MFDFSTVRCATVRCLKNTKGRKVEHRTVEYYLRVFSEIGVGRRCMQRLYIGEPKRDNIFRHWQARKNPDETIKSC
jgi:hypothetical protein